MQLMRAKTVINLNYIVTSIQILIFNQKTRLIKFKNCLKFGIATM